MTVLDVTHRLGMAAQPRILLSHCAHVPLVQGTADPVPGCCLREEAVVLFRTFMWFFQAAKTPV